MVNCKVTPLGIIHLVYLICQKVTHCCIKFYSNKIKNELHFTSATAGNVLSPVLFCVQLHGLLTKLLESGVGCYTSDNFLGALGYADDIVLIAPSPSAMRKLLAICDGYASDYDIIFNADKSKSIVFVSPNRRFLVKAMNSCVFYIGGNLIENVSSYVHLGDVITAQLNDFDDILQRRNNYIGQVNNVACYFDKLTWTVR